MIRLTLVPVTRSLIHKLGLIVDVLRLRDANHHENALATMEVGNPTSAIKFMNLNSEKKIPAILVPGRSAPNGPRTTEIMISEKSEIRPTTRVSAEGWIRGMRHAINAATLTTAPMNSAMIM